MHNEGTPSPGSIDDHAMAPTFASEWRAGGGRIVAAAAVGIGFGLSSLPFYTLGVFAKPLAKEFGWTRGEVQMSFAFMMTGLTMSAAIAGWLVDRYGVRRVALTSMAGFAIGLAALGLNTGSIVTWYATWFCLALAGIGTTPISWTRGIADWFVAGRGTAIGIGLTGSGVAAFVMPPIVGQLIERVGWRGAYFCLAASILVIAIPSVWILFRPNAAGGDSPAQPTTGLTLRQALQGYRFWLLAVAIFAIGASVAGVIPSLVPLLTDKGLSPQIAARYASIVGLAVILGRVTSGFLVDRIWAPAVAAIFLSLPAASCLLLIGNGLDPAMIGIAAVLIGLAAGAEIDLIAFLCIRYFGTAHYGQIYGWQLAVFSIAAGFAPMVFGRVFDVTGSYDPALLTSAVLLLFGALSLLLLGGYPSVAMED